MNDVGRSGFVTRSTWNLGQVRGGNPDIVRYMEMAAPIDGATWVTVHHRVFIPGREDPIFPGNAHQTIGTAVDDARYWASKGHCVYLSQGMYRNPGPSANVDGKVRRYPRADRTYQNLVACKNLYIDVDVKKDGYATTQEAAKAIKAFVIWLDLEPTIIVGSGSGGFHVYWTLDTAIDRKEFANTAGRLINAGIEFGLKFDRQCTRDATRLLRVAGTWNFKHATDDIPATPVTLAHYKDQPVHLALAKDRLARFPAIVTPDGKGAVGGGVRHRVRARAYPACWTSMVCRWMS